MPKPSKEPFWKGELDSSARWIASEIENDGPNYPRQHDQRTNDMLLTHTREDAAATVSQVIKLREELKELGRHVRGLDLGFLIVIGLQIALLSGCHW